MPPGGRQLSQDAAERDVDRRAEEFLDVEGGFAVGGTVLWVFLQVWTGGKLERGSQAVKVVGR